MELEPHLTLFFFIPYGSQCSALHNSTACLINKCLNFRLNLHILFYSPLFQSCLNGMNKYWNTFRLKGYGRSMLSPRMAWPFFYHFLFNYKSFKMITKVSSMKLSEFYFFCITLALPESWLFPISRLQHIITNIKKFLSPDYTAPPCPWQC